MKITLGIIASIASLGLICGPCCSCRKCCHRIERDSRFVELANDLHGENRWKLTNELHHDYDMSRDAILERASRK